jgi:aquaporin Z
LAAALAAHWPEYLMEAAGLGMFMISACVFGVLLDHPMSPVNQAIDNAVVRRALAGIAMGCTAVAIFKSPWGKRSGAHINPAVTLNFALLGKIAWRDALFYIAAQFTGGIAGVFAARLLMGPPLGHPAVNYVVTAPGAAGPWRAFEAEVLISALMMTAVLLVSNNKRVARATPFVAGALVAAYITIEAPLSGMSMNPARSFGSAFAAADSPALWIYFVAPCLGMALAGQFYRLLRGAQTVYCAKLDHSGNQRCIFRCRHDQM